MNKFALATLKMSSHYRCFDEVVELLFCGINKIGYECIITDDFNLKNYQYIVFGANLLYHSNSILPEQVIIYNLEQIYPDSPWLKAGYIDYLLQYSVIDYSLQNIEKLKLLGAKNLYYLPIGYLPELTRIPLNQEKNIDVLFYGSINDRRQKIIDNLEKKGLIVKVLFGVYGKERDDYIARSKIVLNMHFYEAQVFEIVRVSYLLANQVFVISEKSNNSHEEEVFKEGLIFADYHDLVSTCSDYLERDQDREKIAYQGFQIIQKYRQEEFLTSFVSSLQTSNYQPQKFIKDFYRKTKAKIALDKGNYQSSIELYQQSLQVDSDCLESYVYLALALLYNDDYLASQFTLYSVISEAEEKGEDIILLTKNILKILSMENEKQLLLNNVELSDKINIIMQELHC